LGEAALEWFEVIGAGDIVPNLKPAADIYQHVLKEMNLDAADVIAFEDSQNGIISATGAELKTLVTINEYTKTHTFEGALAVFDSLGEPNTPCSLLAGNDSVDFVNVAYLRVLHEKYC
jgi:beta-phosphoglucomutase-like phosphatase (HAD superfamily)